MYVLTGDTHLGGEDFDQRLMAHCLQKFKAQHKKDFSKDQKAMARLRKQCEIAKRTLSTQTSAQIEVSLAPLRIITMSLYVGTFFTKWWLFESLFLTDRKPIPGDRFLFAYFPR